MAHARVCMHLHTVVAFVQRGMPGELVMVVMAVVAVEKDGEEDSFVAAASDALILSLAVNAITCFLFFLFFFFFLISLRFPRFLSSPDAVVFLDFNLFARILSKTSKLLWTLVVVAAVEAEVEVEEAEVVEIFKSFK